MGLVADSGLDWIGDTQREAVAALADICRPVVTAINGTTDQQFRLLAGVGGGDMILLMSPQVQEKNVIVVHDETGKPYKVTIEPGED